MTATTDDSLQPTLMQRISERRTALEAKLRAKRAGTADTTKHEEAEAKLGKGEEQVRASRRELTLLKTAASDAVTKYRVETDAQENERRIREEVHQAARMQKTQEEASMSQRRQGSIQMKFDSLYQCKVPQDLLKEIEQQREACNKVIEIKDQLIREFRAQLRDKEEEYVKSLKQQSEDIDRLIETMHAQTNTMVAAYTRELKSIEDAFCQERRELLDANEKEIEGLVNQRRARERDHGKRREARVWEDQKVLEDKYEENAEKYNKSKMDMQHDIHGLAQEMERMRALYLLNAERLNYNLQVLRERVRENGKAINQHKKKLARLQDVLSSLISKYNDSDRKHRQVNNELTASYRRVTEQYKDLQLKFQHFEKADAEKFKQVWQMHENDCMKLVHECFQADRVVFEQQLGVAWVPPSLDFWLQPNEDEAHKVNEAEEQQADETVELSENATAMLQILYSQAPFLVDETVREVVDSLEASEATSLRVETVLKSLNIKKTEDVEKLLEFFLTETEDGSSVLIHPQEAIQALHHFLEDRRKEMALKIDLSQMDKSGVKQPSVVSKKVEARKAERLFWERMASCLPEAHQRIWKSLERGLETYLKQLQERSSLIEETDTIRKQNDELRGALNQFLGSKINEELFAPPQLVVNAMASTAATSQTAGRQPAPVAARPAVPTGAPAAAPTAVPPPTSSANASGAQPATPAQAEPQGAAEPPTSAPAESSP